MADNLPDGTPAPNGPAPQTPPSEPVTPAADANQQPQTNAPLIQFDSLDADQKKYLAGQGITSQDQLTGENLLKVVNHARSSQQTAAERQAELDRIKAVTNPQPQSVNPFAPAGPQQPSTTPNNPAPDPTQPANPAPAQSGALDPLAAYNLANNLAMNFPEIKADLESGKFYQDMQALSIPLKDASGQVNINGILQYGKIAQKEAQLQAQIAELNKPAGDGIIPEATPTTPQQPDANAPMTAQMARAIGMFVAQGNTHARSAEAQTFLEKQV